MQRRLAQTHWPSGPHHPQTSIGRTPTGGPGTPPPPWVRRGSRRISKKNHNLVRRFDCIAWEVPDTIATIIVLITPVLVWAIPNKKLA